MNAIVEVVLVDEVQQPNLSHPFHLHGEWRDSMGLEYLFEKMAEERS